MRTCRQCGDDWHAGHECSAVDLPRKKRSPQEIEQDRQRLLGKLWEEPDRNKTRHLDTALATLRKPARAPATASLRATYERGLQALGWKLSLRAANYSEFNKWTKEGCKTAHVYEGDSVMLRMSLYDQFKPLPPKARRNIALAGQ